MDILDKKSTEIVSFFSDLDKILDGISQALKNRNSLADDQFLTTKEVCKLLCISPRTLQEWRNTGKIPFIKIGGKVLYEEKDIKISLKNSYSNRLENIL